MYPADNDTMVIGIEPESLARSEISRKRLQQLMIAAGAIHSMMVESPLSLSITQSSPFHVLFSGFPMSQSEWREDSQITLGYEKRGERLHTHFNRILF